LEQKVLRELLFVQGVGVDYELQETLYNIKVWYWNYRAKGNQYQSDNKQIHFEILQDNERVCLLTWYLPDFLDGIELVNQFMVNKYRVMNMLSKINYSIGFESCKLKSDLVEIAMGENDIRVF